jgi:5'-3' exonuclease
MEKKLFEKPNIITGTLSLECLEADDCIALFIKKIHDLHPCKEIYVITNDHDYLQLKTDTVYLINLKYQKVGNNKTTGDAQKDLFIKAVCGDKSDNINKIFENKKIGPKKAEQLYNEINVFKKLCEEDSEKTYDRYLKNMNLISFENIPIDLINKFYNKYFGD